jgi:quercetin dioxygenase-like cupin family protein
MLPARHLLAFILVSLLPVSSLSQSVSIDHHGIDADGSLLAFQWTQVAMLADGAEGDGQLKYSVLYGDAEGVTHFREDQLVWRGRTGGATTPQLDATKVGFVRIAAQSKSDWHPAPRKQFLIVLKGSMEVEAQDGERKTFEPGSVLLVDDTGGRGHRTGALGKQEVLAVYVALQ